MFDEDDVDYDLHEASKHDEDDGSEKLAEISLPRPPLQSEVLQELQQESVNRETMIALPNTGIYSRIFSKN